MRTHLQFQVRPGVLTIAHVGGYLAAVFRFTYKNLVCGLGAGACACCRARGVAELSHAVSHRDVTDRRSDSDDQRSSFSDRHSRSDDHLQGRDGDIECQGHDDKRSDVVNTKSCADDEVLELDIIKGDHVKLHRNDCFTIAFTLLITRSFQLFAYLPDFMSNFRFYVFLFYLRQGGLCNRRCMSICLLLATLRKNFRAEFA